LLEIALDQVDRGVVMQQQGRLSVHREFSTAGFADDFGKSVKDPDPCILTIETASPAT
jgi:hypothetical protein